MWWSWHSGSVTFIFLSFHNKCFSYFIRKNTIIFTTLNTININGLLNLIMRFFTMPTNFINIYFLIHFIPVWINTIINKTISLDNTHKSFEWQKWNDSTFYINVPFSKLLKILRKMAESYLLRLTVLLLDLVLEFSFFTSRCFLVKFSKTILNSLSITLSLRFCSAFGANNSSSDPLRASWKNKRKMVTNPKNVISDL